MVEVGRAQGEFGGFDPSAVEARCCPGAQPPDTAIARAAAPILTHQRRRTRDNVRSRGYLTVVMSPLLLPVRKVLAPRASLPCSGWLRPQSRDQSGDEARRRISSTRTRLRLRGSADTTWRLRGLHLRGLCSEISTHQTPPGKPSVF